tara:strand:+ start:5795 stop:5977 length:183 start_codon:yes stop_codon:yes gene_type:complete
MQIFKPVSAYKVLQEKGCTERGVLERKITRKRQASQEKRKATIAIKEMKREKLCRSISSV